MRRRDYCEALRVRLHMCIPALRPVSGHKVPLHRLGVVALDALASAVHVADPVLRSGVAALRGSLVEPHRLAVVLRDALAALIHEPEPVLGIEVTLLRGLAVPPCGLTVVLGDPAP